jgi:hypothetical protein
MMFAVLQSNVPMVQPPIFGTPILFQEAMATLAEQVLTCLICQTAERER